MLQNTGKNKPKLPTQARASIKSDRKNDSKLILRMEQIKMCSEINNTHPHRRTDKQTKMCIKHKNASPSKMAKNKREMTVTSTGGIQWLSGEKNGTQ